MTLLIRPARADEASVLTDLALRSKAHWGYDAEFIESCRDELALREGEILRRRTTVADRDGGVVGFTTLDADPPQGVLGMMFVEPGVIGQGIGRLLFQHTVATGRDLGFRQLTIDADPHAEPFYRAMGAVPVGRVPSGSIPGRTLPRMVLAISG
jgi:GNAT superfamily N-acetyltransferase